MIYCTSDLRKVEFVPNKRLIGSGTQGKVYMLGDDKCIKIY